MRVHIQLHPYEYYGLEYTYYNQLPQGKFAGLI
jgi:hypothetical protein